MARTGRRFFLRVRFAIDAAPFAAGSEKVQLKEDLDALKKCAYYYNICSMNMTREKINKVRCKIRRKRNKAAWVKRGLRFDSYFGRCVCVENAAKGS